LGYGSAASSLFIDPCLKGIPGLPIACCIPNNPEIWR
jgi:hypothetical protein